MQRTPPENLLLDSPPHKSALEWPESPLVVAQKEKIAEARVGLHNFFYLCNRYNGGLFRWLNGDD